MLKFSIICWQWWPPASEAQNCADSETVSQSLHVPLSSPQTLEMGASQSQDNKRQAGATHNNNNLKRNKSIRRHKSVRDDSGYFSVKFKKTQIKIVNADSAELNTIASIIRWWDISCKQHSLIFICSLPKSKGGLIISYDLSINWRKRNSKIRVFPLTYKIHSLKFHTIISTHSQY